MPTDARTAAAQDTPPSVRVWPVTAVAVLLGLALLGWEAVVAVVNAAALFGETPSRDRLVETGMLLVTSALPTTLLCAVALVLGSRWGLLALALPGVVALVTGLDLLARTGSSRHPDADRPVRLADAFQDLTRPNWVAAALLLAALGLVLARRRRQTGIRSNP
jgi:hypothetical protein